MIRLAKPADVKGVTDLGLHALAKNTPKELTICEKSVRETAASCISSPKDFCAVNEADGKIVAAVTAHTSPLWFHKGNQANVLQFYTLEPGYGLGLLRLLKLWYNSRPSIKTIVFSLEESADERTLRLIEKLFETSIHSPTLTSVKKVIL